MTKTRFIPVIVLLHTSLLCAWSQLNPENVNKLFREDTVPRIDIYIHPDSLDILLEDITSDHEYQAIFIYNNFSDIHDTIENVGFRIRGNVSRLDEKKSFKISMNTFVPGRKYFGLEKIDLKATGDPSFIKPKLAWYMCQQMGITSIWVNHVMLYINSELWGVYTNVEHIDEEFVKEKFGNNDGNLYKCRYPADLLWISDNQEDYKFENMYFGDRWIRTYELKTNKTEDNYSDLVDLIKTINNPDELNFKSLVSEHINIQDLLKFFALEVYLGHWDSYSLMANNYYLYHNQSNGKFEYITYDMDLTMGPGFSSIDIINGDIYNFVEGPDMRPLRQNIIKVPEYRNNYTFYLRQLLKRFPPDTLRAYAEQIQNFIAPFVEQDPYYLYSMEEFFASLDEPLGWADYGIIEFFKIKYNSIQSQLDSTNAIPIISSVKYTDHYKDDTIKINCLVEDDDSVPTVSFFYRLNSGGLNSVSMTLVSEDTLKGTYKFETTIFPTGIAGIIDFYIQATDKMEQSMRLPYENYYNIILYPEKSDLRINEMLASNSDCMTDNFGEHEDWIEIVNADTVPLSLRNKYLSDSYNNQNEWQLPDIVLQPGEITWFWADDQPEQGNNHAEFKLSRNGETIYLFEDIGENFVLLDSLNFPEQESDISYGRQPENANIFGTLDQITPGYSNETSNLAFITFDVNMKVIVDKNKFIPGVNKLDVISNVNDWQGSLWFADVDKDEVYTYTEYDLTAGDSIQYRFRVDNDNNKIEFRNIQGEEGHRVLVLHEGCNKVSHYFNDEASEIELIPLPEISVYPNPASDYVIVNSADVSRHIVLTDLNGKIISEHNVEGYTDLEIDISKLPEGVYFIRILSKNQKVQIERIIKI